MTERTEERDVEMRAVTCGGLCALALFGGLLVLVEAGLQAEGIRCGEKNCGPREYCSNHSKMCHPCRDVCEKTSNNYQQTTCNDQCQDYIHEQRFVTRQEEAAGEDLKSVVARLTVLVILTLVVSVLVLLALVATLTLFLWHRKQLNKQMPLYLQSNGKDKGKVSYKTEPLKLEMPANMPPPSTTSTAPPPVTPATTSTPLSSRPRYPKEDPTLEYHAYDNPALTPSPVFENNQQETTPVSRRQESSF